MNTGIIVLGMHRSGTSLIAEMVHRCGVFGRSEECLPPNQWNARGYWELTPLVDFNERLLRAVGANWSFPTSWKQDAHLAELAHQPCYQAEAKALVGSMQQYGNNWFWKDPRLSLLLPFWRHFWGKPRYIICSRDPLEICRTLSERDHFSFSVSTTLWHRYMLAALEGTQNESTIVMSYANVLQKPEQECKRLAGFLQKQDGGAPDLDIREMRKSVHKELRHCQATGFPNLDVLSDRQRKLHQKLEALASQPAFSTVDWRPYSLSPTWRVSLLANLLLLKCQRRWNRAFPGLPVLPVEKSDASVFAISNARGLEIWQ